MIEVKVRRNELVAYGHADFDEYGKDVVCAAISSILQSMGYLLVSLGGNMEKGRGRLRIEWKDDPCSLKAANVMIESIKSVQRRYPEHVKLEVI